MPTAFVIENESYVSSIIGAMLARTGWTVVDVRTATEIVRTKAEHAVDLLVIDIISAGKDGLHFIQSWTQQRPQIALLLMSGYPRDHMINRALLAELDLPSHRLRFLEKPFTIRALIDAVARLTERTPSAEPQPELSMD